MDVVVGCVLGGLSVKQAFGFDPTPLVPLSVKLTEALVSVLTVGTIRVVSELRGHWPPTDVPEARVCKRVVEG